MLKSASAARHLLAWCLQLLLKMHDRALCQSSAGTAHGVLHSMPAQLLFCSRDECLLLAWLHTAAAAAAAAAAAGVTVAEAGSTLCGAGVCAPGERCYDGEQAVDLSRRYYLFINPELGFVYSPR
jgi:hypothetical protein